MSCAIASNLYVSRYTICSAQQSNTKKEVQCGRTIRWCLAPKKPVDRFIEFDQYRTWARTQLFFFNHLTHTHQSMQIQKMYFLCVWRKKILADRKKSKKQIQIDQQLGENWYFMLKLLLSKKIVINWNRLADCIWFSLTHIAYSLIRGLFHLLSLLFMISKRTKIQVKIRIWYQNGRVKD